MSNQLFVVCALSNPMRYQSRYRLYERFARNMLAEKVHLTTVELVYDDRITWADRITDAIREVYEEVGRPDYNYIPLRTRDVMWHKESLLNVGIQSLPREAKYIAWLDADIEFLRPGWDEEIVAALNHYDMVQVWSEAQDMSPDHRPVIIDGKPVPLAKSFMAAYRDGDKSRNGRYDDNNWHPGYGWSIRRDAYDELGGLLDTAILGAADRHMAMGLIGEAKLSYPGNVTQAYKDQVLGWEERAQSWLERNVGYVPGMIAHWWHGRKKQRGYHDRWRILVDEQFNPVTDLRKDTSSGIWRWSAGNTPRMQRLRDKVRAYFASRNEDSVDVE